MLKIIRSSRPIRRQLSTSPSLSNISRLPTTESAQPIREESKPELPPSQLPKVNSPAAEHTESSKSPSLSSYNAETVKQRIREWTEQVAIILRKRADGFTATTKAAFAQLGSELNRVTGYEEIEALKRGVVEQGGCLLSLLSFFFLLLNASC